MPFNYKHFAIAIFILPLVFFGTITTVNAVDNNLQSAQNSSNIASKCTVVTTKIDARIVAYNENKQKHFTIFNNSKNQVTALVAKLQAKNVDVSKLQADLKTLEAKINQLSSDHSTFITSLEATKSAVCGNSNGTYLGLLEQSKKNQAIVKQDIADIRSFYEKTIRTDIQAIRATLPKNSSSSKS